MKVKTAQQIAVGRVVDDIGIDEIESLTVNGKEVPRAPGESLLNALEEARYQYLAAEVDKPHINVPKIVQKAAIASKWSEKILKWAGLSWVSAFAEGGARIATSRVDVGVVTKGGDRFVAHVDVLASNASAFMQRLGLVANGVAACPIPFAGVIARPLLILQCMASALVATITRQTERGAFVAMAQEQSELLLFGSIPLAGDAFSAMAMARTLESIRNYNEMTVAQVVEVEDMQPADDARESVGA